MDESWKTVTMPEAVYCRLKECERQLSEYKARAERAEQERDQLQELLNMHAKVCTAPSLDSPASVQCSYQSAGDSKEPAATIKESLTVQPSVAVEWIARDVKCPHESLTKWAVVPTKRVRKQDAEAAAKAVAECETAKRIAAERWERIKTLTARVNELQAELASTANQEGG